jgi:hypothetical protein
VTAETQPRKISASSIDTVDGAQRRSFSAHDSRRLARPEQLCRVDSVDTVHCWVMAYEEVGAALTIATLCFTLSTSMGIVMYHPSPETYALVNALRIIMNTIGIVYLF